MTRPRPRSKSGKEPKLELTRTHVLNPSLNASVCPFASRQFTPGMKNTIPVTQRPLPKVRHAPSNATHAEGAPHPRDLCVGNAETHTHT